MSEPFQKELKLTTAQKAKLKTLSEAGRGQARDQMKGVDMRNMPQEERQAFFTKMQRTGMRQQETLVQSVGELLTEKQQTRFQQVILQIKRPTFAIAEPAPIAESIGLRKDQFEQVTQVIAQYNTAEP